jgi:CBS domain-containing protein
MVIGAFTGGAVWRLFEPIVPSLGHDPAPYVIVGMMACFGSISRAPLAVMLMVAEMTGTLSLIVPAMVAVGLATLIVRRNDDTIYRSQLRSRSDSPAHRILTGLPLLGAARASQAMAVPRCVVPSSADVATALSLLETSGVEGAPFVGAEGRYVGVVTLEALRRASEQPDQPVLASLVDTSFLPIHQDVHLDIVLDTLTSTPQTWVAVVDDERRVIGTIATSDLIGSYRRSLQASLRRVSEVSESSGMLDVVVAENSPIVGASLRAAAIPKGVLITAIERGREVIRPTGDTVMCSGDRLMVLGTSEDLTRLQQLAVAKP